MFKATMHKTLGSVGDLANLTSDTIGYIAGYVEHARKVQQSTAAARLGADITEEEHQALERVKGLKVDADAIKALRDLAKARLAELESEK